MYEILIIMKFTIFKLKAYIDKQEDYYTKNCS
jgi:hypothetical protein